MPEEKKKLPGNFRRIRLELAREPGHPHGDHAFGYTLVAPLDADNRIDPETWHAHKTACRVVRFRPDGTEDIGHIKRVGTGWKFHYDIEGEDADETGFRLGAERFTVGEYVSIKSEEVMHVYRVVSVAAL